MSFPPRLPGWRLLLVAWGVYAGVWTSLEGAPAQVMLLGAATALVAGGAVYRRWLAGRTASPAQGLLLALAGGAALGAAAGLLTLLLMGVKTGLHAHGPEFTPAEIGRVWRQVWWWTAAGAVAGPGAALLLLAWQSGRSPAAPAEEE